MQRLRQMKTGLTTSLLQKLPQTFFFACLREDSSFFIEQ